MALDPSQPTMLQRVLCPIKPHEKCDLDILNRLATAFIEVFRLQPELTKAVLRHYAKHARPDFAGVIFLSNATQGQSAQDLLRWLQMLGLKKQNIRLMSFDVAGKRSKHTAAWKTTLGLRSDTAVDKVAPLNGRRDWPCPWFGIEPVFLDASSQYRGSPAFRFLMVMGFLGLPRLDLMLDS